MIFALAQPVALLGLAVGFLLSVAIRAGVHRYVATRVVAGARPRLASLKPNWRTDIDAFGVIAVVLGGLGWGKAAPVNYEISQRSYDSYAGYGGVSTNRSQRRAVAITLASGPIAVLIVSQLVFLVGRLLYPDSSVLQLTGAADVLNGASMDSYGEQFTLSLAVAMLCFGLVEFIPLPPLDGWGLLWLALRRPPVKARHWLVEQNLGVVILLVLSLPLLSGAAILPRFLDIFATPLMRLWS
jgi:hypothetical protein